MSDEPDLVAVTETPGFGFRGRCRACGWAGKDRGYHGPAFDLAVSDVERHIKAEHPARAMNGVSQ